MHSINASCRLHLKSRYAAIAFPPWPWVQRCAHCLAVAFLFALASLGSGHAETDCRVYPIALPAWVLVGAEPGDMLDDIFEADRPGNFGWLSWSGATGNGYLVDSLTVPGNKETYVNPDEPQDHALSAGDWVRGLPGVKNSKSVRKALDALMGTEIIVPVWEQSRGAGDNAAFRIGGFAIVEITDYRLPGKWIKARYVGSVDCGGGAGNAPPEASDQTLVVQEDDSVGIVLEATDADGDALTFAVATDPLHGTLLGTAPDLVYTPADDYSGSDGFTFTASDGTAESAPATVSITVQSINDPPEVTVV